MRSLTVVICLKNQALDQFLKEVLKCTQKVIRVGSQSQSAQSPLERDLDVKLHQMEHTYRGQIREYNCIREYKAESEEAVFRSIDVVGLPITGATRRRYVLALL